MTQAERLAEYSRNAQWFYNHRERLRSQHPDKYVAIVNQSIVDSADELEVLAARLEGMGKHVADVASLEFVGKRPSCMLLCA